MNESNNTIGFIDFINPDTKTKISIPLNKSMIFIYGKNGSGKTTFSRAKALDPKYVFNEDFVYKNVYIIDGEGAKTDSNIKNNFSELLIGEDVVKLKYEQNKFEEILKKLSDNLKDINEFITSSFLKNGINVSYNSIKDKHDDNFIFNIEKSIDEQIAEYRTDFELEQFINSPEEFEVNVNQIKKHENIKNLIDKISSIDLLKEYLFSDKKPLLDSLNTKLKLLNDNSKTIKELEEIFLKKNVSKSDFNIIKDCLDLHIRAKQDSCVLCGSPDAIDGIEEWKKIFNDKFISLKNETSKYLKNVIDSTKQIISDKKIYLPVAPLTIQNIDKFIIKIEEAIKSIDNETIIYINYDEFEKEIFTDDILKKVNAIANYLLKPYKDKIIFYNSSIKFINDSIRLIKTEIENKLKQNADIHKESINNILSALGFNKEISVDIDRLGGKIKYSLSIINNNLSKLSDGQKHKLALAIFLNTIKNVNLKGKTLVFDDPVVSLDELGYHLFKEYLIKNIMSNENKDDNPKLIILTHNFNYLYIQISNIITNLDLQNCTQILKLNSSGYKELEFELFKYDDIALFKKCILNIQFEDQLIDLSSLYNKIFREFLDLRLRIIGKPLNGNPSIEIKQLGLDSATARELQKESDILSSYTKSKNIDIIKAKSGFQLLLKMIRKIGFQEYLNEDDEKRALNLSRRDTYSYDDIYFIVHEISELLKNNDDRYDNYKNYLNHPRISYTRNIISTSMDT